MDHKDAHYFMVKIVADTLKDYPINADVNESNTSVSLMTPSVHVFNFISRIHFSVSHRAHDAPIFAIRLQFLTNHVCGSALHNNLSDFYPVYKLRSDITTVALSSYFLYNKNFQLILNKTGHIHGTCQLHVEGQCCSQCRCKKLNINFWPYDLMTEIITTHKIDVSIMTKGSMAGCILDIGIWEHFGMEDGQKKTYYHEWKNIYRLRWYVIFNKGYSLVLNTSCDHSANCSFCSELCNIAVSIDVQQRILLKWQDNQDNIIETPLTDIKSLYQEQILDCLRHLETTCSAANEIMHETDYEPVKKPFRSNISLSKVMHDNWYEAQEFCLKRNSHLITLESTLLYNIKNILLSETDFVNNWEKSNIHVFAGLYRSTRVL